MVSFIRRAATQSEIERLPFLMPRWRYRSGDQFVVAEVNSPTRFVGGVVFGIRPRNNEISVGQLDVAVFPRFRETDLLEQLVQAAVNRCKLLALSSLE